MPAECVQIQLPHVSLVAMRKTFHAQWPDMKGHQAQPITLASRAARIESTPLRFDQVHGSPKDRVPVPVGIAGMLPVTKRDRGQDLDEPAHQSESKRQIAILS